MSPSLLPTRAKRCRCLRHRRPPATCRQGQQLAQGITATPRRQNNILLPIQPSTRHSTTTLPLPLVPVTTKTRRLLSFHQTPLPPPRRCRLCLLPLLTKVTVLCIRLLSSTQHLLRSVVRPSKVPTRRTISDDNKHLRPKCPAFITTAHPRPSLTVSTPILLLVVVTRQTCKSSFIPCILWLFLSLFCQQHLFSFRRLTFSCCSATINKQNADLSFPGRTLLPVHYASHWCPVRRMSL